MPDGRQKEFEESLTEAFWKWIDKTYSAEEAQYLREKADDPDIMKAYTDYFGKVVYPNLDYPELTGEALRRKRAHETAVRFATYTGRVPKDWMLPLMTSFPEGFGGYEAGTAGFFKALAPEKYAEWLKEMEVVAEPEYPRLTPATLRTYFPLSPEEARRQAFEAYRIQPEYQRAFTETAMGLAGPQPFRDWFGSQYPSIVAQFKTTIPKLEERYWPGLGPKEVEERVEQTWAEYLKTPRFREEYATRYPLGQYGRPWAFAPRIQTVRFGA